ncbi:hypothetical protein GQ55_2G410400 [Panicum hallii var. hallii]|uniref:PGG domain-containing protein n=1 Tax=Panicum hallii var. hallii TaxID=1504633 RepID=A0A2T7EXR4_9POAL|nr:hypothetical protein GQ55_2G410400 [Panicum hallii var. hallii]
MYAAGNGVHVQMPGSELDQQRQQGSDHRLQNAAGGGGHALDFATNTRDTLLVVPTLISGLSYQLGTNIPGGYWQDDAAGHAAGDPIMRDKYGRRYWLFMAGSWVAFGASTLLTVGLLTRVPPKSRLVRGAFCLVLTFLASQPRTSLAVDLAVWVGVVAALAVATKNVRLDKLPGWARAACRQNSEMPAAS